MINTVLHSIGNIFWPGIANHIWQSTIFAVIAWVITLFLKKNRARVRYWIWFAVSVKFLLPFALIVNLGSIIAPEWSRAPVEAVPEWAVIRTINQPFSNSELTEIPLTQDIVTPSSSNDKIPLIIISIWLCGSLAILAAWYKKSISVSSIIDKAELLADDHAVKGFHRLKQKSRISGNVRLASTGDMMEPGVYGFFRPVLVLPEGILKHYHVNDSELEAILLHEFAHIRSKDNLIALIHMLVQVLFWFHPFVWWTGSRLVFERELACDESVLQNGKNPREYAEGILKVCEYYFKAPLACVSGIIGANLKKRVESIMKNQTGHKLSMVKKLFLLITGLSALGLPLALGIINTPQSQAYSSGNDFNKYIVNEQQVDVYKKSEIPKMNIGLPEVSRSNNQDNSILIPDTGAAVQAESSGNSGVSKNENPVVIAANVRIETAKNTEIKTESIKRVQKTELSKNDKENIVVAKRKAPDEGNTYTDNVLKAGGDKLKSETADNFISLGISFLNKGKIEKAVSAFNRAIDIAPEKAVAYFARGSAYQKMTRYEKALSDYNRTIEINPGIAAAYQNRGSIYLVQGKVDNAISDYSKVLELNPGNAAALSSRGTAYLSLKQYKKALNDFNMAIKLNPGYVDAYVNRGRFHHITRNYDKAIDDYKKALELNPDIPSKNKLERYCTTMAQAAGTGKMTRDNFPKGYLTSGVVPEGQVSTSHEVNMAAQNWANK